MSKGMICPICGGTRIVENRNRSNYQNRYYCLVHKGVFNIPVSTGQTFQSNSYLSRKVRILTSKYFWIALLILVPFFSIWGVCGLTWAVIIYVLAGFVALFALTKERQSNSWRSSRRQVNVYHHWMENEEEQDVEESTPESDRDMGLFDFSGLRSIQEKDLNKTTKRLRHLF